MKKRIVKRLLITLGLTVGTIVLLFAIISTKQEVQINTSKNEIIEVSYPTIFSAKVEESEELKIENAIDVVHHVDLTLFDQKIGYYELVERHLGNGTTFLFERIKNETWIPFPIKTVHELGEAIVSTNSWNPKEIEHPYHPDFGEDPTINPWGIIVTEGKQVLKGNVYLSKEMTTDYGDNKKSVVRKLDNEIRETNVTQNAIQQTFWLLPKRFAESWSLVSDEKLFTSKDAQSEWI